MHKRILLPALNCAVLGIASRLFPKGYDVSDNAPNTLPELIQHVNATGRMLVYSGASDFTIYGCPEVNWAFRAWHDHCHLRNPERYQFDLLGETELLQEHRRDVLRLFGQNDCTDQMLHLIYVEIVGQATYLNQHGLFPEHQIGFVCDWLLYGRDYALSHKYSVN